MTRFLSALGLATALLAAPFSAFCQSKASEIPVETFWKLPEFTNMALSPNGKLLAALTPLNERENLVVIDLEKKTKRIITSFNSFDVVNFSWVNNNRIFFRVAEVRDRLDRIRYIGTYAIDVDGENLRNLTDGGRAMQANKLVSNITPMRRTDDGTDDMIVAMNYPRYEAASVYRLDTKSGRVKENLTSDSPADTQSFVLDWNRVPRVALSLETRTMMYTLWYRDGKDSPWGELMTYSFGEGVERISPIAFNADNKTLWVASNIGRDKAAIYSYDPKTKKLGDLVFEHPLIDVWGGLIFQPKTHNLIGIRFNAEKPQVVWIDPEMRRLQAQVDAALPKTYNTLTRTEDASNMLITSVSDVSPHRFYLLSTNPLKMEEVASTRPWLKPELMSERHFIKYKARDGLEIPAWVTIPRGSSGKNLPLVVNIHGGPWVRVYGWTDWGRPEAQFFASRGYAVLEPEPRASDGFGRKHVLAGDKQWGLSMQDDITDGVLHLVKEGVVDKAKVCLYGGSYGGYATLMGLVKEPELFKCGIPLVAVTDVGEFVGSNEADYAVDARVNFERILFRQVGDPKADRELLRKASPAYHADRIKAPVLLAMGQVDQRVPLIHGRLMRDAMEKAGVKHEYIVYPGEGHGWNKHENNIDWYKRVEKFLAENLK